MNELVNKLAELQEGREAAEMAADKTSNSVDGMIAVTKQTLIKYEDTRRSLRLPHEMTIANIDSVIEDVTAQIIEAWDGEKKTIVTDAGTLKFRTTQSLKIKDGTLVLTGLLDHTSVKDVATNYIKGFNLTAVKKYMGVLDLPLGAAELIPKTTLKLEVV